MNKDEKIKLIRDNWWRDVTFNYKGQYGIIMPDNIDSDFFTIGFGDITLKDKDYERLIKTPIFEGKSLLEIADDLTEVEAL